MFADSMTVLGLIKDGDRLYEVEQLALWWSHLHHLGRLNLPEELLIQLFSAIFQSVLCTSITVWIGLVTKPDKTRLQQISRSAEENHCCQSVLNSGLMHVWKQAGNMTTDPSHPEHNLFQLQNNQIHEQLLSTLSPTVSEAVLLQYAAPTVPNLNMLYIQYVAYSICQVLKYQQYYFVVFTYLFQYLCNLPD